MPMRLWSKPLCSWVGSKFLVAEATERTGSELSLIGVFGGFFTGSVSAVVLSCQSLRVPCNVLANEAGNEMVAVVVAFLHT